METDKGIIEAKEEHRKIRSINALKVVYYYLNDVQPNDILTNISAEQESDEILNSISVVKGLFNRALSQDSKKWKYLTVNFDFPRNDEIGEITDLLFHLRQSIKNEKTNRINTLKNRLQKTNINYYIVHYLTTENAEFVKAGNPEVGIENVNEQKKEIPINAQYGKSPFELPSIEYINALKRVYYYLNNVQFDDDSKNMSLQENEILNSCSIVKGLFNRVLRQDRRDWFTVATCFDYPNNDEIIEIAGLLQQLRQAIKNNKNTKIQSIIFLLQQTNINLYIVNFLTHERAQFIRVEKIKTVSKSGSEKQEVLTPKDRFLKKLDTSSKEQRLNIKKRRRLKSDVTIWIFEAKQPCYDHTEMVESITAEVLSMRDKKYYPFNVSYCRQCEKYYINRLSYEIFSKKYGMPAINRILVSNNSNNDAKTNYYEWNVESLLHTYGYNVNSIDNLPRFKRQEILSYVIDHKIMTKEKVVSFLEVLIKRNQNRVNYDSALSKWKDDLQFVLNYQLQSQPVVKGEFELPKRKR